jgi:hypothetical protein
MYAHPSMIKYPLLTWPPFTLIGGIGQMACVNPNVKNPTHPMMNKMKDTRPIFSRQAL